MDPASAARVAASVLFIGNSLTATNDLPARTAAVAAAAGHPLRVSSVTLPGASLGDHWQDGRALAAIQDGHWDVVALQQGPSTRPDSRADLIASARKFAAPIRAAGGKPALLMVWPMPRQAASAVSASYRAAAQAVDGLLLPAGEAWTAARARDPGLALVQEDGFHPSALGTAVAALAVECALFPQDAKALVGAKAASGIDVDASRWARLVDAACTAAAPAR